METTRVYWGDKGGYIGIMGNNMETTIVYWSKDVGFIRVLHPESTNGLFGTCCIMDSQLICLSEP